MADRRINRTSRAAPDASVERTRPGLTARPEHGLLLSLQRAAGNAAVVEALVRGPSGPLQRSAVENHADDLSREREGTWRGEESLPLPPTGGSRTADGSSVMLQRASTSTAAGASTSSPRLAQQVGPSCWIYVVEAIASSLGISTKALSLAIRAYPIHAEVDAEHEASFGMSKREVAIRLMKSNLDQAVDKLEAWETNNRDKKSISEQDLLQILPERLRSPSAMATLYDQLPLLEGDSLPIADLISSFKAAYEKAKVLDDISDESMAEFEQNQAAYRTDEDIIFGSSPTPISTNHPIDEVRAAVAANSGAGYLESNRQLDYAAGLENLSGARIDFTGLRVPFPRRRRSTQFAVMHLDEARGALTIREAADATDRADLVVTTDQLTMMTGSDSTPVVGQVVAASSAPVIEKSDLDGAVIDLTGCPQLRLANHMHSLLVIGHDDAGATVKDPNLGNAEIKLTIAQISELATHAQGRPGKIQSYRPAEDGKQPRIHELGDGSWESDSD